MTSEVSDDIQAQLPDLTFKSVLATWDGKLTPCSSLWGGYALGCPVLESTPLKDVDWATLFAYMHRRFGPPHVPGDDYKDLSAGWMLTTQDACVFVRVTPSLTGPGFSFTPYFQKSPEDFLRHYELELLPERVEEVKAAYRYTLLDLLRPVGVRDHLMNAMGELGDTPLDDALQDGEDEEQSPYIVDQHASSGYSMPIGLFGGEEWGVFCTIIRQLGNGNMQAGRAAVIARIQADVFKEAAIQSREVKRLMLMSNFNHLAFLGKGLMLSDAELSELCGDLKTLSGPDAYQSGLVDQLKLEDVDMAVGFLSRLGWSGHGLKKRVESLKIDQAVSVSCNELLALPNQCFPDESIPDDVFNGSSIDLIAHMRGFLNSNDRSDLLSWIDSTLARPYGMQALCQIACHIKMQTENSDVDQNAMVS